MARILILRDYTENSVDSLYRTNDYRLFNYQKGTNVGNKLWLAGLISTISTPENEIDYLRSDMTSEYINSHYDLCIKPEANIFQRRFVKWMNWHVDRFEDIQIPIYVIACGAQGNKGESISSLADAIREPATRFIRSIYNTGGEFCLRGYFTKQLFDELGFNDAVVTGCPSLYQRGRHLKIEKKQPFSNIAINGNMSIFHKDILFNENSNYIDQGEYFPILYGGVLKQLILLNSLV